jgi:hypothetical protein
MEEMIISKVLRCRKRWPFPSYAQFESEEIPNRTRRQLRVDYSVSSSIRFLLG